MIPTFTRDHTSFMGAADNRLDAEVFGDNGPPVLLLHGGGQTNTACLALDGGETRKQRLYGLYA